MYFTPDGLEQATRQRVAAHRAARLAAFETKTLIDLGCGIGGDLLAASRAGLTCRRASTSTRCASRSPRPTSPP